MYINTTTAAAQADFDPALVAAITPERRLIRDRLSGERPELVWIDKHLLGVDDTYQRDEVETKVHEISAAFSWAYFSAISVAKRRDGSLFVFDGQNRVRAAMRRSDIRELPCVVHRLAGVANEADAFLGVNTRGKPVKAMDKFKAAVVAGHPEAVLVQETLETLGVELSNTPTGPRQTKTVYGLMSMARRSPAMFKRVITTAATIADYGPISYTMLKGLEYLDRRIEGGLENRRLVSRLIQVGGQRLDDAAKRASAFYGQKRNQERVCGDAFLEVLNKGLKDRFEYISNANN